MWWRLSLLLLLMPITSIAGEGEDAVKTIIEACRKDDRIAACKYLNQTADKVKDTVNSTIKEYGLKDTAFVMATATSLITQKEIRIKGRSVPMLGNDTSYLQVGDDRFQVGITWSLP